MLGLLVNLIGLFCFSHGHDHSHGHAHGHTHSHANAHDHAATHNHGHHSHAHDSNLHGVFLHILSDTLGSVAVIISSMLISRYQFYRFDSISSIAVSLLTIYPSFGLLMQTINNLSEIDEAASSESNYERFTAVIIHE